MNSVDGMLNQFLIMGIIFFGMYFFIIKPQNKRAQEQKKMLETVGVGEEIVLSSGIVGKINKIIDEFICIEIADGIEIKVQKQAITNILPKGTMKKIC